MKYKETVLAAVLFFISIASVSAQVDTESFSIKLFSIIDVTPPSVPGPVTVDPIASTQIDVTWGASTDDYFLSGYVLFRNDTAIATTTQTTFSDVGLIASTTYSYYVQAFDSAFNYSATSTAVATTTPNPPVPPPVATSTSQQTAARTVLDSFLLTTTENEAGFTLTTARPARIEIRWGRTASYELGYTFREQYVRDFETTITDLEPGTRYEYEIIGYTPSGAKTVLKRGQFLTKSLAAVAPSNVRFLTASFEGSDVTLNWLPPEGGPFRVRVVRSNLSYPLTPTDGAIVYQGTGVRFFDEGVLDRFSPAYYTVFVVDENGNVSSGAVVQVALGFNGNGVFVPPTAISEEPIQIDEGVAVFDNQATTSESAQGAAIRIPQKQDILLITEDTTQSFEDVKPSVPKSEAFSILIPKDTVSTNLKTIILSFADPRTSGEVYSYILRLNKEGDAYEAVVNGLDSGGWSQFTVSVYDFEAKIVATYSKRVWFGEGERDGRNVWFPDYLYKNYIVLSVFGLGFIFLLWLLGILLRRLR